MPKTFLPLAILSLVACCIEMDISVPGFPDMVHYFEVSEGIIQRQLWISITVEFDSSPL